MILGGMCKKHYDEVNGVKKGKGSRANVTVAKKKDTSGTDDGKKKKGGHQRGLSLFQDNDSDNRRLYNDAAKDKLGSNSSSNNRGGAAALRLNITAKTIGIDRVLVCVQEIEEWTEGRGRGEDYEDFGEAEGETGDTEE